MRTLTGLSLLLVILLVSLSAYLRLAHSGIGCDDWPDCYGRIGLPEVSTALDSAPEQLARDAYARITAESQQAMAWATPLHRGVASLLGLCILFLTLLAVSQKQFRLISLCLLGLTVWLAMLGLRSGSLHDPAVVMGNLAGGYAMLGLLGWLWFSLNAKPEPRFDAHRPTMPLSRAWIIAALLALCAQILVGGLTSANFAANSCDTQLACQGSWWPGAGWADAIDLSRHHQVTPAGQAIGGEERVAIHRAHRLMAGVASVLILLVAQMAMRRAGASRLTGMVLLLLIVTEFSVGVAAVYNQLPIGLAVAHNWLAGLLLLTMLKLLSLQERR